jgi:membrane protease YdiL (CAAX protease family)
MTKCKLLPLKSLHKSRLCYCTCRRWAGIVCDRPSVRMASRFKSGISKYLALLSSRGGVIGFIRFMGIDLRFSFFSLEFFFRGFVLQTLKYSLGSMAVPVMVIPYTMIHFSKPLPECIGAIIAGLVLGFLSLKTNRIWGGVLLHVAVAISMDVLALWRNNAFMFVQG